MKKNNLLGGHLVVSAMFCLMMMVVLLTGQLVYFYAKITSYQKICQYNQAETMKNMTILNQTSKKIDETFYYNLGTVEYQKNVYRIRLKNNVQYTFLNDKKET
ncbi:hypothetical protein [Dellaglioa carnosa]|uniref:Uncharacterized protein n=1 Tax=Dellaglioa carnosa TaxID=2995136 RepID=A0ABT4JQ14_9LACO|nr:hypothetical protein [Dellaglioa carnosa]MCZ2491887.1 hypothetical protein [Dellaglioa carnosa]MCZ2494897.1 hypothetical protein [Dellaglioa carnosa]MDK1731760.1 hypothetical protein [Dellaglioa carnosa]